MNDTERIPNDRQPAAKDPLPGCTRLARKLAAYEWVVLALAAPFFLFPGRWTPLVALLIPLLWINRWVAYRRLTVPTPLDGAIVLLFLATLVGLYTSVDAAQSLPRLWAILLGLALFYSLANSLSTLGTCRLVGDLLIVGGLGLAILALFRTRWENLRFFDLPLYQQLATLAPAWPDKHLTGARTMGMALSVLAPLPLAQVLTRSRPWRRWCCAAIALVMVAILLLTQSIQGVLGLAAALLLLAVCHRRWFLLAVPLGLGLLVAVVFALGPQRVATAFLTQDHPVGIGVILRLDMWGRALAMIRDMPYTGIGLDTFSTIQSAFYSGFIIGPEPHAHNLYLQVALDLGLPGLLALLWLLVAFAWTVLRANARCTDSDSRALLLGAAAGVAAYLAAGLIDTLWPWKPSLLLWLLLGLAVALSRLILGEMGPSARRWRFLPLLGILGLILLSLVLWPGLSALNRGSLEAHQALTAVEAGRPDNAERLSRAAARLEQALGAHTGDSQTYRTLARLYGWLGEDERAVEALENGIRLDLQDPLGRYGPWVVWLRGLQGQSPAAPSQDLLWVYTHWMNRYPRRAESYVQVALLWAHQQGDLDRARAVLQSGVERGAQPAGLLTHSLSHLTGGP